MHKHLPLAYWLCVHNVHLLLNTLFTGGRDPGKNDSAEILGYKEIINYFYFLGNH